MTSSPSSVVAPAADTTASATETPAWPQTLTEMLTPLRAVIVFAAGSVGIAVLRFVGQHYAYGYFTAQHIPLTHLTFSVWDYGVPGLFVVWAASIIGLFVVGFVAWYLRGIGPNLAIIAGWPWLGRLGFGIAVSGLILMIHIWVYGWAIIHDQSVMAVAAGGAVVPLAIPLGRRITWRPGQRMVQVMLIVLLLIAMPFVSDWLSDVARKSGTQAAQRDLRQIGVQVQFVADTPGLIDQPAVAIGASDQQSYRYQGLYFLTFNDGRYFVFDQLTAACTPSQVYIVREEDLKSAQYVTAPPPACATPAP